MTMDTPVLLIAWRRPHTLRQVIDAIRPVAPTRLYVACDGPNPSRPEEAEKVAATRAVLDSEIDWPCQIDRLYSDINQGCFLGVSRAIAWFFDKVEEGIILEDDCVPHPDFFTYCTNLLDRYRHDMRVWCISGTNFQDGQWRGDGSYYFSRYMHCWGWASWRQRWHHYDADLHQWPVLCNSGLLEVIFDNPSERKFWSRILQQLWKADKPHTWDFQWAFTCFVNGGLITIPNRNLVSNVGFGKDATHTTGRAINTSIGDGLDLHRHPSLMLRHATADRYTYDHHYRGKWRRLPLSLLRLPRRAASVTVRRLKKVFGGF